MKTLTHNDDINAAKESGSALPLGKDPQDQGPAVGGQAFEREGFRTHRQPVVFVIGVQV